MEKKIFVILLIAILSTPFVVLGTIKIMQVKTESHQNLDELSFAEEELIQSESIKENLPQTNPKEYSPKFISGYRDGWHGKWLGPVRWTINDDYRQGHMLGSYDRKNGINRELSREKQ
jgi:hypothetical protein